MSSPVNPRSPHSWHDHAACRHEDAELFFPGGTTGAEAVSQIQRAKRICARCPVREICLQWALDSNQRFGIWGGLTETERETLRRATEMNEETAA